MERKNCADVCGWPESGCLVAKHDTSGPMVFLRRDPQQVEKGEYETQT